MRDPNGQLARIRGARLDLGCGARKRSGYIGIDRLDDPAVDIVGDVFEVLNEIPDGAVEGVFSSHFFEHVDDIDRLLAESLRVVRPGGRVEIIVPHFSNPYFYSDPTHRRFFGLYSLGYFTSQDACLRRQVPRYGVDLPCRLASVDLVFKSSPPFVGRYALKRSFGWVVNRTRWTKEFYEENLSYIVPCYELRFVLVRRN